jgi:hypothetical protein
LLLALVLFDLFLTYFVISALLLALTCLTCPRPDLLLT